MSEVKSKNGKVKVVIELDPDTDEIIKRHCFNAGTKRKRFIQECCDLAAEQIKSQFPDTIRKPNPERIAGLKEFALPTQSVRP